MAGKKDCKICDDVNTPDGVECSVCSAEDASTREGEAGYLAPGMTSSASAMVSISKKNLQRVHDRNKELNAENSLLWINNNQLKDQLDTAERKIQLLTQEIDQLRSQQPIY